MIADFVAKKIGMPFNTQNLAWVADETLGAAHCDGPSVVFEWAGLRGLAFLKGGHHLIVVDQETHFMLGELPVNPANGCNRPQELRTQERGMC